VSTIEPIRLVTATFEPPAEIGNDMIRKAQNFTSKLLPCCQSQVVQVFLFQNSGIVDQHLLRNHRWSLRQVNVTHRGGYVLPASAPDSKLLVDKLNWRTAITKFHPLLSTAALITDATVAFSHQISCHGYLFYQNKGLGQSSQTLVCATLLLRQNNTNVFMGSHASHAIIHPTTPVDPRHRCIYHETDAHTLRHPPARTSDDDQHHNCSLCCPALLRLARLVHRCS